MRGVRAGAIGLLTGWGQGLRALPADARRAAGHRRVVPMDWPAHSEERFRRATREGLLGVAAVEALLASGDLARDGIRGNGTAILYATASAYGASNRAFIEATGSSPSLHFPYTAPSAVPAQVAIEFGLSGPYVIFLGGAVATIEALWYGVTLLTRGGCDRVLVLAVETFQECQDLYARTRWLAGRPLVEAAVCVLLTEGGVLPSYRVGQERSALESEVQARAGETLACAPLIALALARETRPGPIRLTGAWRGRRAALDWGES